MEIIKFGNDGLIDSRLWSTFGVSVKDKDDSIGRFGTGLKYAIAILMRENRSLRIVSGDNEYIFGVEATEIRGKEFQQITCNGVSLPFTTHLGSHWELWQAYRELYSNCLDEGGGINYEGETVVYAELGDINHSDVFFDASKFQIASSGKNCDIFYGESAWVYFRGIRAYELSKRARYTYNLKNAYLTEDRTLKYPHEIDEFSSEAVLMSSNHDFLVDYLTQTKNYAEENFSFQFGSPNISNESVNVFRQFKKRDCYKQEGFVNKVSKIIGPEKYEFCPFDERQKKIVDKAICFCERIGFPIKYEVKLTDDLGENILALADRKNNCILLSVRVLTMGVKQVVSTLIEENLHIKEGLDDCTYKMQTYLFDQIVTMGEKLTGEVI